ncbi:Protein kinase superfamily protein [Histomonas meleagridis]|uniref:Protein kinase superfamily protein n=1 Tax=Histomonas meleagridis TaxID=135588 RepID=UPI003559B264|nr:Protein kinase superfamily protein [Histomonas meleagridis]KAH0797993.1 Protein kinase superfamily protein [Histomonas meleagridis]
MCLTASNILYSHGVWKITDFGSSTSIDSDSINYDSISKKLCPPEILLGNEVDSLKVDIWQLGCLLYKMCTQKSPFKGKTESEIIHAECAIPENLNSQMTELIKFCLNPDPRCRPTIIGVLSKTHLLFPAYTDPRHCHPPKPNCSTEILSLPHSPHPPLPSFPPPGSKVTSASLNQIPRLQRRQHVSYNRINRFKRLSESQLNEINSQVNRLNNLLPPVNVEEILDRIMNDRDNLVNELLNSTPNDFNNTLNLEMQFSPEETQRFLFCILHSSKTKISFVLSNAPIFHDEYAQNAWDSRVEINREFPMFEGNFSLHKFKRHCVKNNIEMVGSSPICLKAINKLQNHVDFIIEMLSHDTCVDFANEALFSYQIISYIISKLLSKNIDKETLEGSVIKRLEGQHRKLLPFFAKLGNGDFPIHAHTFKTNKIIHGPKRSQKKKSRK